MMYNPQIHWICGIEFRKMDEVHKRSASEVYTCVIYSYMTLLVYWLYNRI
jgi:hypothetical protein